MSVGGLVSDSDCVALLEWALPRRELRWEGFRHVRSQVCKRIARRIVELGLADTRAYRERLEADLAEWDVFDRLCLVTISRFYRDRSVWETLEKAVLPELARTAGDAALWCWSVGCASGEEPYTLSIVWHVALAEAYPRSRLRVLGTDVDENVLARARAARYPAGALRELPEPWRREAFDADGERFALRERFRRVVRVERRDARSAPPARSFQLVLCRNSVFTYFAEDLQRRVLAQIGAGMATGGALVLGQHERLPQGLGFEPWYPAAGIYRRGDVRDTAVTRGTEIATRARQR